MDFLRINSYLYYGYGLFTDSQPPELPFPQSLLSNYPGEYAEMDEASLVSIGSEILTNIFTSTVTNSTINVIPLSGGLDSRAVLAGFLENGQKENLVTVTFGTPGTLDFEIGKLVARKAGVYHETIDLTKIPVTTEKLIEAAQNNRPSWTGVFDTFYNRLAPEKFGRENTYWSGFFGDALSGSHLQKSGADTWPLARIRFAEKQRYCKSIPLFHPDFDPLSVLPEQPICNNKLLSYYDQLDFAIRQMCFVKPIVLSPANTWHIPFLDEYWVRFLLFAPRECRENQKLYKQVLLQKFPHIFSLPTKNNQGLPLQPTLYSRISRKLESYLQRLVDFSIGRKNQQRKPISPNTNYIDFNMAVRERNDIKNLVYENLQDLKARKIIDWMDINEIWTAHQARTGDYGAELTTLTGLEINLKVQDSMDTNNIDDRKEKVND